MDSRKNILGIILAGGQSRRMGTNKSIKEISGKKLIDIVLNRAQKQVDKIAVNSNTKINFNFAEKFEIIPDCVQGNLGPLVGILTGMKWAKMQKKEYRWLVTFPVDSPFFPDNLIRKFLDSHSNEDVIIAKSNERLHPVFSLWNTNLVDSLEEELSRGVRKIEEFTKKFKTKVVNFSVIGYDPFFNINNANDLLIAEKVFQENF